MAKRELTRPSLRGAIDAYCKDCIYDPLSGLGNWRQQVTGCPANQCPLYPVRPISHPRTREDDNDDRCKTKH